VRSKPPGTGAVRRARRLRPQITIGLLATPARFSRCHLLDQRHDPISRPPHHGKGFFRQDVTVATPAAPAASTAQHMAACP
jgi:hypothetical protein